MNWSVKTMWQEYIDVRDIEEVADQLFLWKIPHRSLKLSSGACNEHRDGYREYRRHLEKSVAGLRALSFAGRGCNLVAWRRQVPQILLSPVLYCNPKNRSPHVRESGFRTPRSFARGIRNPRSFARGIRNPRSFARGIRNPRSFARGIRNPGSIILPLESRIFGFEIWNLTNDRRPESKFHHQRLEFSAWNPESMAWNLESETILDSLTFNGVRASWQEKYFSALQLLASISPWKLPFSPGQRVFFFLLPPSFSISIMKSVANSMLLVAVLIVCVHRKSSNKRLRGGYLILRVQEGGKSQHWCQNPCLGSFLSSLVFPYFDHNIGLLWDLNLP